MRHIALSGDGQTLVVEDAPSKASVVGLKTNEVQARLQGQLHLWRPAITRDGRLVATGSWHGVEMRVWDARTGAPVHRIPHVAGSVAGVVFSPDGRWLLTGTCGEYRLLEAGTWREQWRAAGDAPDIFALPGAMAFTPDGDVLAVTHSRQVIKLLDRRTGRELATLTAPDMGLVGELDFGAGGRFLAATTNTGSVHVWDLQKVREHLAALGLDWGPPTDGPDR
jgi:WD40 repeat protein